MEGGRFGSALVGLDLETERRWRCDGLPTRSPLLAVDENHVALETADGVSVVAAESCKLTAAVNLASPGTSSAVFEGDRLRLTTWRARDLVVQTVRLADGGVENAVVLPEFPRAWSPDGSRLLVYHEGEVQIREARSGEAIATLSVVQTLQDAEWLADGTILLLDGEWGRCAEVRAFDSDGVAMWTDARDIVQPVVYTHADGSQSSSDGQVALVPGPRAGTALACGCGPCDLLHVQTGRWLRLPTLERPARGWYRWGAEFPREYGRAAGSDLAIDFEGQLVSFTAEGELRRIDLP